MCGFDVEINGNNSQTLINTSYILNRGPDCCSYKTIDNVSFFCTVLHHQGQVICEQPVKTDEFLFAFNGDNFLQKEDLSDTEQLAEELGKSTDKVQIIETILGIKGPYSLVFYSKPLETLFFSRDYLGRNSLIIARNNSFNYVITSIADQSLTNAIEVPPTGVYMINVRSLSLSISPWKSIDTEEYQKLQIFRLETVLQTKIYIDNYVLLPWFNRTQDVQTDFNYENLNLSDQNIPENVKLETCYKATQTLTENLVGHLRKSVQERVSTVQPFCKICNTFQLNKSKISCIHSKVAILFSGGVDCSIVAALTTQLINRNDSIDLINVSFSKTEAPDTISARETFEELKKLDTNRRWNLISVNVSSKLLKKQTRYTLRHLIYPLQKIIDVDLGAAFWFASQSAGVLRTSNKEPHKSTARVILIGSGADELFGGYKRHRTAYLANPCQSSIDFQMKFDWNRLPYRNLGRDDRIVSYHGVTPRQPFVEENFTQLVQSLESSKKCFFQLRDGFGDKLLLRIIAHRLGFSNCCFKPKRAIQFGSKVASSDKKGNGYIQFFDIS